MEIVLILFGPAIFFWLLLALPAPGKPFLTSFGIFVAIAIVYALAAGNPGPSSGPDDWFHGIELAGLVIGLVAAIGPLVAQAWRHLRIRQNRPTYYVGVLIGVSLLVGAIASSVGGGF